MGPRRKMLWRSFAALFIAGLAFSLSEFTQGEAIREDAVVPEDSGPSPKMILQEESFIHGKEEDERMKTLEEDVRELGGNASASNQSTNSTEPTEPLDADQSVHRLVHPVDERPGVTEDSTAEH